MKNCQKMKIASNLLEDYYEKVRNEKIYSKLVESTTFNDENIANALYLINDESYDYITKNLFQLIDREKYITIFNVFSGSGRLIREINDLKLIDKLKLICNIDCSREMIEFEKNLFSDLKNIEFICNNFLEVDDLGRERSIIICHCGLRYLENEKISIFVEKIKDMLIKDSICFVSETKYHLIELVLFELKKMNLNYELVKKHVLMHRNTKLYTGFSLYYNNDLFQQLVNEISIEFGISFSEVLLDISGYKKAKQYIIKITSKS